MPNLPGAIKNQAGPDGGQCVGSVELFETHHLRKTRIDGCRFALPILPAGSRASCSRIFWNSNSAAVVSASTVAMLGGGYRMRASLVKGFFLDWFIYGYR
jgi:hypothetical protein